MAVADMSSYHLLHTGTIRARKAPVWQTALAPAPLHGCPQPLNGAAGWPGRKGERPPCACPLLLTPQRKSHCPLVYREVPKTFFFKCFLRWQTERQREVEWLHSRTPTRAKTSFSPSNRFWEAQEFDCSIACYTRQYLLSRHKHVLLVCCDRYTVLILK